MASALSNTDETLVMETFVIDCDTNWIAFPVLQGDMILSVARFGPIFCLPYSSIQ